MIVHGIHPARAARETDRMKSGFIYNAHPTRAALFAKSPAEAARLEALLTLHTLGCMQ